MSKKTLITIIFITTIVIISGTFIVYAKNDSDKYELVNSTKDEVYENTSDKNKMKIYEPSSRGNNIDRTVLNEDERNINSNISTNSEQNVENHSEKVIIKEEFVQGVKVTTYNNVTYNVFSTGEKEITNEIKTIEFDNSTYNGNTSTLLDEAKHNIDEYMEKRNMVLNITNKYREEVGLNKLVLDRNLSIAASVRALEMAYTNKLSHIRPDGAKCFRVLDDLNIQYYYAGENIGDGFKKPENVCEAWKNSESHYKNIANTKYNKIGVGVAQGLDGKYYWVQIFSN